MKSFYAILSFCLIGINFSAQREASIPMIGNSTDSVSSYLLNEAKIIPTDPTFEKEYQRAKYYTLRVYEYAMLASDMLNEFQDSLGVIERRRDESKYLKSVNKYLKDEFGDEIQNMSINRGKFLMKIIHKETGLTAYEIIENYRGGVKAKLWQGTVAMFGTTLKYEYEPLAEDKALAKVLQDIELGKLKPLPRPAKTDKAKEVKSKRAKRKAARKNRKKNLKGVAAQQS